MGKGSHCLKMAEKTKNWILWPIKGLIMTVYFTIQIVWSFTFQKDTGNNILFLWCFITMSHQIFSNMFFHTAIRTTTVLNKQCEKCIISSNQCIWSWHETLFRTQNLKRVFQVGKISWQKYDYGSLKVRQYSVGAPSPNNLINLVVWVW